MSEVAKFFVKVLLSISISGAVLAAALLALQAALGHRLSQRWRYYVWLLVVAKLLIPVNLQSSAMGHLFDRADAYLTAPPQMVEQAEPQQVQPPPQTPAAEEQGAAPAARQQTPPPVEQVGQAAAPSPSVDYWVLAWRVWLGVSVLLILRTAVGSRHYQKLLQRDSLPVSSPLVQEVYSETCREMGVKRPPRLLSNAEISSPMLAGLFRPVIVLPPLDADRQGLRYVFLHELTHYKRRDGWYKLLMHLTVSLHWFNPMAYQVRREMEKACELSCDEAVIRRLDAESRLDYGDVLLSVVKAGKQPHRVPALLLGEDAKTIKSRLSAILRFRPRTGWMLAAAGVLTLVLATVAVGLGGYTIPQGRAYGNDSIIARESDSMSGRGILRSVEEDGSIRLSLGRLDGAKTFLRMEVTDAAEVEFRYNVSLGRGDYKIVLVREGQVVDTIAEGTATGSRQLELAPGVYRLKSVGRGARAEASIALAAPAGVNVLDPELTPSTLALESDTQPEVLPAAGPVPQAAQQALLSARIGVRGYDNTWAEAATAQGTTPQEVLEDKLRYLESVYRNHSEGFIIDERVTAAEAADPSGPQYMYDRSEAYRQLVAVTDTVAIASGTSFSVTGVGDREVLYERHAFYLDRPATMDLQATYTITEGRLGFLVVSPQGEILHNQELAAAYSGRVSLPLTEGLWSIVLVEEAENGRLRGQRYMMGYLDGQSGNPSTPSREEVVAEYAAAGFSYDDMAYEGRQVAYFDDKRTGGWLAVSRKSAGEDAVYLSILRDNSVPGPLGYGEITGIETYTKEEWEQNRQPIEGEEIQP